MRKTIHLAATLGALSIALACGAPASAAPHTTDARDSAAAPFEPGALPITDATCPSAELLSANVSTAPVDGKALDNLLLAWLEMLIEGREDAAGDASFWAACQSSGTTISAAAIFWTLSGGGDGGGANADRQPDAKSLLSSLSAVNARTLSSNLLLASLTPRG